MKLEYNGVPMSMIEMHEYNRTAVYDVSGIDLLYLHYTINATVAVYPGGYPVGLAQVRVPDRVAAELTGVTDRPAKGPAGMVGKAVPTPAYDGPRTDTVTQAGVQPAYVTDKVVAYLLSQPRKKLKITAYRSGVPKEEVWLESPRPGFAVDAVDGPHVMVLSPGAPAGEGVDLALNLQIETCLPPADVAAERAILSHRWKTQIDHDENYYPARTVSGTVVFNSAVVRKYGYDVDHFRNQLFHPIPLGHRRAIGPILFDEGQHVMTYSFTDTLVECVFDPANTGATQMEIVEDVEYSSPFGV